MLEQARKDRGLSLSEVEQATKIRKRYLQGLERDDYAALPDAIYARGFLKTYANFLGLDGEQLAWQLKTRRAPRRERLGGTGATRSSDFDRPLISPGGLGGTEKRLISGGTVLALAVGLLALTAVIGTLYYIGRGSQSATEDATPSQEVAEDGSANPEGGSSDNAPDDAQGDTPSGGAEDAPQEDAGGDEPAAQPDVLKAVVKVEGAPSWLQILSDGEVALEQVAEPGFSQTFEAKEKITIYTGNAGAVSVEINGQDVGTLGENGEVLTRDFNLKAGT